MKASRLCLLILSPTLLLFGGCIFDPIPPDYTNYPSYNGGVDRPYPGHRYGNQSDNSRPTADPTQPGIDQTAITERQRPEPIPRENPNRISPPPTELPEPDVDLTRTPEREPQAEMGIRVPGKKDLIYSPYVPRSTGMMDVQGLPSGTKIYCEWTDKIIIVP